MTTLEKMICADSVQEGELRQPSTFTSSGWLVMQFLYIWEDRCIDARRLEASLRRVLAAYPAVAGRLVSEAELLEAEAVKMGTVKFTNEGVPFKVVQGHPGSAKDVPSGEDGPTMWTFADYPKKLPIQGGPLLTVKLTCFESGGCILGLGVNHVVFDGWAFGSFMRDWSAIHAGHTVPSSVNELPLDFFKRPSAEDFDAYQKANSLELVMSGLTYKIMSKIVVSIMAKMWKNYPQQKCVISFSEEELRMLKAKAEADAGTWVSTNEALLAHLHPLMLEVFKVSVSGKVGAQVPVNLRGKIQGIDERAFGNNVAVVSCVYDVQRDQKSSVSARVHEALRAKLVEKNLINWVQLMGASKDDSKYYQCKDLKRGSPGVIDQWNYQVTTPYFQVDFGVGTPTRAQPWSGEPVKVMPSLHGGVVDGVDVMISKSPYGVATWAKNKYARVGKFLSLLQFFLLCVLVRRRRTISKKHLTIGSAVFAICMFAKKVMSKKHQEYIDSCFKALEEHPQLKAFVRPSEAIAHAGA
jgi:hypothetical protein